MPLQTLLKQEIESIDSLKDTRLESGQAPAVEYDASASAKKGCETLVTGEGTLPFMQMP